MFCKIPACIFAFPCIYDAVSMKTWFITYFKYLLLAILVYMPVFGHLDTLTIRLWDESRLAVNAFEMYKNGNWLVTYFNGLPDLWNTKPPLMIWLQVLFMKILGVGELAVRMPSAIAGFFTCIVLLVFSIKYIKDFWFGFIAVLVLVTSQGYISLHAVKTGDYDALLTLFTTLYCFLFYTYLETGKKKYIYLFFINLALAILTKSVAGLLFLPGLFIYTLWQRKLILLLKTKDFYFGIGILLVIVGGFYFLREIQSSGYWEAVHKNELGGRYMAALENHKGDFWYYYNNFITNKLTAWYLLIPCGLGIGFFHKDKRIFKLTVFSFLMAITFFLVISTAQTKLDWYDVPLYPFLSVIISVFIYYIFSALKKNEFLQKPLYYNILPFLFIIYIFNKPYKEIFDKVYLPKENSWDEALFEPSYLFRDALNGKTDLNNYLVVQDGYNANNFFYIEVLKIKGVKIAIKNKRNLKAGDKVIVFEDDVKAYILNHYKTTESATRKNIVFYKIIAKK